MLAANTCPKAEPGALRLSPARSLTQPQQGPSQAKGRDTVAPTSPRRSRSPAGPAEPGQRGRKPRLTPASASRRPLPAPAPLPGRALPREPGPSPRAWPLPRAHLELPKQPQEGQQPDPATRRHRPPAARPRPRLLLLLLPGRVRRGARAQACGESGGGGAASPKLCLLGVHSPQKTTTRAATAKEAGLLTGMSAVAWGREGGRRVLSSLPLGASRERGKDSLRGRNGLNFCQN